MMMVSKKQKAKVRMGMHSTKDAHRVVVRNGFRLVRTNGDHYYYKKEGFTKLLNLSRDLNRMVWERIVKDFKLDLNI